MIIIKSEIILKGVKGKDISDFLINCTDKDYQNWWSGTHLSYHTIKQQHLKYIGNIIFCDEYIGKYRFISKGLIIKYIAGKEIIWQMLRIIKLPVWLTIRFEDISEGVKITHTIAAGYKRIGRILDVIFKMYLSNAFKKEMKKHFYIEFNKLRDILYHRHIV